MIHPFAYFTSETDILRHSDRLFDKYLVGNDGLCRAEHEMIDYEVSLRVSRFEVQGCHIILSENSYFNAMPIILHPTPGSVSDSVCTATYDRDSSGG